MKPIAGVLALAVLPGVFGGTVSELARRIVQAGLDPEECYRVRELNFVKEDLRFYLTDGYLILAKPVDGTRSAAVFTADVEGGDAELLLFPPNRSERLSLANYAGSPNLSEHFKTAVFIFTDDTYARLAEEIRARESMKKSPETGVLLAQTWQSVVRNMSSSFQIRLAGDLLGGGPPAQGFFYAGLTGLKLANFDVLYDPRADEQITIGQVATKEGRTYFDVWTRFPARSFRNRVREAPAAELTLNNFRTDAIVEPDLRLRVKTSARMVAGAEDRRAITFYGESAKSLERPGMARVPALVLESGVKMPSKAIRGGEVGGLWQGCHRPGAGSTATL